MNKANCIVQEGIKYCQVVHEIGWPQVVIVLIVGLVAIIGMRSL